MNPRISVRAVGGMILALLLGLAVIVTAAPAQAATGSPLGHGYSINLATGTVTGPGDLRDLYVQVYDAAANHQTRVALTTLPAGATTAHLNPDRWADLSTCQVDVTTQKQATVNYPNGPGSRGFVAGRIITGCGHPTTVLTAPTVNVAPGTCTTPGTLTYTPGEHYTVTGTPTGTTGPGDYTVTATAGRGFTFTGNHKTVVLTGSIEGKQFGAVCAGPKPEPTVTTATSVTVSCTARTTTTVTTTTTTGYVLSGDRWVLGVPVVTSSASVATYVPAGACTVTPPVVNPPVVNPPVVHPPVVHTTPVVTKKAVVHTVAPVRPVAAVTELPRTGGDAPVRGLLVWGLAILAAGVALRVGSRRLT